MAHGRGGSVLERLGALGVLRVLPPDLGERLRGARPEHFPLVLCEAGALEGGLSVALDVRPDEAIGALCAAIGGGARTLRVEDVRDRPEPELAIAFGELRERWAVGDVRALVRNLNDLFREDASARAVAVLGEWEDALQLWCVPKDKLRALEREAFFAPENRRELEGDR